MNREQVEEIRQALFEEAGDALFLFDPESEQIIDANPMAQRLSGYPRAELLRMKATFLFRSETPGGLNQSAPCVSQDRHLPLPGRLLCCALSAMASGCRST